MAEIAEMGHQDGGGCYMGRLKARNYTKFDSKFNKNKKYPIKEIVLLSEY